MRRLAFFLLFCVCLCLVPISIQSPAGYGYGNSDSERMSLGIWYEDGIHPLMVEWVPNTYGNSGKLVFTLQTHKYTRNLLTLTPSQTILTKPIVNLLDTATVNIFMSLGMLMAVIALGCSLYKKLRAILVKGIKSLPKDDQAHNIPPFTFATVSAATNRFSNESKIGEGGFGHVCKGVLSNGMEIAVKRMSFVFHHGQGVDEFLNEVNSLARLQHRNLVKLLGSCTHKSERMLIYQFMPNKSLDHHLFDRSRRSLMSWTTRYSIIKGIARGLLYIHEDSMPTIIHRDMKASNVLLDNEMIPKISDFGLARIKADQTEMITEKIIGTEGYIAPDYRNLGIYSVKSDVYSFGVLALEIISGRRSQDRRNSINLIQEAWNLYAQGRVMQLVDPDMERDAPFCGIRIKRCIQMSLLCIQHEAAQRPEMSAVVFWLSNATTFIPQPNPPPGTTRPSKWVALWLWLQYLRGCDCE